MLTFEWFMYIQLPLKPNIFWFLTINKLLCLLIIFLLTSLISYFLHYIPFALSHNLYVFSRSLSAICWKPSRPPSFVTGANLIPSSESSMEAVKWRGLKINPWALHVHSFPYPKMTHSFLHCSLFIKRSSIHARITSPNPCAQISVHNILHDTMSKAFWKSKYIQYDHG